MSMSGKASKMSTGKSGISAKSQQSQERKKELEKLCSDEITIPSNLPGILKAYTKGAIRTQPANLLVWSIAYFRCMQYGLVPPVKDKIEPGTAAAEGKLTVGFLQVLHKQLGTKKTVTYDELLGKWKGICQDEKQLSLLYVSNKMDKKQATEWKRILPLLTTLLGTNMNEYMTMVCQVCGKKPQQITIDEFVEMYSNLAKILKKDVNNAATEFLQSKAKENNGCVGPKQINDPNCPKL